MPIHYLFRVNLYIKLAFLSSFLLCRAASAQPYTNLALEGGGIRGIAYAGAFEELQRKQLLDAIQNVAGTSVGAAAGCLLSVGYSAEEITKLLFQLDIETFNDGRWFFLGGQWRMRKQYGWYQGNALERWIEKAIAAKTGRSHLTFAQLHELTKTSGKYKDLYVTAGNLTKQRLAVFCWKNFPDMEIATAVRVSMSIPLYFRALMLDGSGKKSDTGDIYVDGGVVMNYPLTLFDSGSANAHTLGLKLERPEQMAYYQQSTDIAPYAIADLKTYMGALYNLTIETTSRKVDMEDERFRTIYISTAGLKPRVRKITKAQKTILYESGRSATRNFLN